MNQVGLSPKMAHQNFPIDFYLLKKSIENLLSSK